MVLLIEQNIQLKFQKLKFNENLIFKLLEYFQDVNQQMG